MMIRLSKLVGQKVDLKKRWKQMSKILILPSIFENAVFKDQLESLGASKKKLVAYVTQFFSMHLKLGSKRDHRAEVSRNIARSRMGWSRESNWRITGALTTVPPTLELSLYCELK